MHMFTFGGLTLGSADHMMVGGPVVRGGEGKGRCMGSDGALACRVS